MQITFSLLWGIKQFILTGISRISIIIEKQKKKPIRFDALYRENNFKIA